MDTPVIFITGGFGCIGAETAKWLLGNSDCKMIVSSRSVSADREEKVFGNVDRSRIYSVQADVCDQDRLQSILAEHHISHVLHLAGLQTPDCNRHRNLGLQTNLAGTQNMIEAIKASGLALQRFVFASSIAVYGPRSDYAAGPVPMDSRPNPVNVYGAWKLAGENISRMFAADSNVPTISVRPGALFGPGRDAGLTSTPTTAMKHVALRQPYEIPYCSRQDYLYAPDVGAAIGNALLEPFQGYAAFTLPSHTVDSATMVEAMRKAAAELGLEDNFNITVGTDEVPFICDVEYESFLNTFPESPRTSLDQAVRQSVECFLEQKEKGTLHVPSSVHT